MNEKPHTWLVYYFSAQHADGSIMKGNLHFTTKNTGYKLFVEAGETLQKRYPEEENIIIANMSDLGEETDDGENE